MIFDRPTRERLERERHAPYAMNSGDSRGRRFPEDEHPYRTVFQRDRDRIIHTAAFRRLQYKTQVVVYYEDDHFRSRLTHSLEVAQIGRTLARALGVNEDLTEAICLAHDLGHPPFGHTGEWTLNDLMRAAGTRGFHHQRQAMRLVEQLEPGYPDHPGLNLTYEVREGIVKHDPGFDKADARDYEPDFAGTLECQLANLADEIAYNTADLEDGLRSGILQPDAVRGLALWQEALASLGQPLDAEITPLLRRRAVRRLIGKEVTDVIDTTDGNLRALGLDSCAAVRQLGRNVADYSAALAAKNAELKGFLLDHFYRYYRVRRMQSKATRTLTALFEAYMAAPVMLPPEVQARVAAEPEGWPRVICDYLANMTDRYALAEYARLFDPNERS